MKKGPTRGPFIHLVAGVGWPSRLAPLSYVGQLRWPRNKPGGFAASQVQTLLSSNQKSQTRK